MCKKYQLFGFPSSWSSRDSVVSLFEGPSPLTEPQCIMTLYDDK